MRKGGGEKGLSEDISRHSDDDELTLLGAGLVEVDLLCCWRLYVMDIFFLMYIRRVFRKMIPRRTSTSSKKFREIQNINMKARFAAERFRGKNWIIRLSFVREFVKIDNSGNGFGFMRLFTGCLVSKSEI